MEFLYDVPDILYKFRDWDNANSHKLLFERQLFFSSYARFNDPFDGGVPFQYDPKDLTPDNIFRKYYDSARQMFPNKTDPEIHALCYEQQKMGNFENDKFQEDFQKKITDDLAKSFGIVCLCKSPVNFLLWSYYAQSHKGFAIGFKKKQLFEDTQAQFAHMQYQEDLPKLGLFEDPVSAFAKLIGTKSKIWEHEDEYRLSKINFADQTLILRPETIADITCGCKMAHENKIKIIDHVKKELPHVTIHEMSMSKEKFELIHQRIF